MQRMQILAATLLLVTACGGEEQRLPNAPTYRVRYEPNGATAGTAPVDPAEYAEGGLVSVLGNDGLLVRDGQRFEGWNTAADGTGESRAPGSTFVIGDGPVTLWAKWAPLARHAVLYDGNGATSGTPPEDVSRYLAGDAVSVRGNTGQLGRDGQLFDGWNTAADGTGESRAPGSTFVMGDGPVTLWAKWVPLPRHAVLYEGNGATSGTPPEDASRYLAGEVVTVLGNGGLLGRYGYLFDGWNTRADGTGESRAAGSTFVMGDGPVTLWARWSALPRYAVTYHANGATGGAPPEDVNTYLEGEDAPVLGNTGHLVRAGHRFTGWNTAADGSGTHLEPGSQLRLGAGAEALYAEWLAGAQAVACSDAFSLTLLHGGGVRGVGHNYYNQLGAGPALGGPAAPFSLEPLDAALVQGVVAIAVAAGDSHAAVVDSQGRLWVVGSNANGQLGDGTWLAKTSFTQVSPVGAAAFTAVYANRDMTFALDAGGVVWVSGDAPAGEFGPRRRIGTFERLTATGLGRVRAVASGDDFTLLLDEGGDVWASGYNDDGQLGDGTGIDRDSFAKVIDSGDVAQVVAGYDHALVLRTDGTLWAAGDNWYGQLGLGTTSDSLSFVELPFDGPVATAAAGWSSTYVVDADGALWAAGYNGDGQLGDGTQTHRSSFVRVLDAGVSSVHSGGSSHYGFAVLNDGSLRSAGRNHYGQLGDGTQSDRSVFGPALLAP